MSSSLRLFVSQFICLSFLVLHYVAARRCDALTLAHLEHLLKCKYHGAFGWLNFTQLLFPGINKIFSERSMKFSVTGKTLNSLILI